MDFRLSYSGNRRRTAPLHLARTDKIALAQLLLASGLSREFLSRTR
jgi:hypothetical protein